MAAGAEDPEPPRDRHDPLAALRQRNFLIYVIGRFASASAMTLFQAAIAWQVYEISGSALQLGVMGLVRFVPSLMASLVGGAVADSYDRRRIVLVAQFAPMIGAVILITTTAAGVVGLPVIYGVVLLLALASAFEFPARQALLPSLVSRETFPNAITVQSSMQSLAFVTGPALGGVMIAVATVTGAYALNVALIAVATVSLFLIRPRPIEGERRAVSIAAIREGVRFVLSRQVLLGSMALDMFAVIFGGAQALLPIYATDILEVGPRGYGLLSSALPLGALLMSFALVALPPVDRTGRALLFAVAAFGFWTIAFGLSRSFPLSVFAYMMVGASDQISVIMRTTTIQLSTPDVLRGRVSSVNSLFIGASNQLGAVESGFVAAATSATFAVVSGGLGCLAVLAAVAAKMPLLRAYRVAGGPAGMDQLPDKVAGRSGRP